MNYFIRERARPLARPSRMSDEHFIFRLFDEMVYHAEMNYVGRQMIDRVVDDLRSSLRVIFVDLCNASDSARIGERRW